ncbi:glycosyltransferase [Leptolyngbya ohadii]|uniref:glycosyltransferase n=1 Tax=Leptolyngbya ohadii TaxID=1962290 RepID=UPI000B59DF0A|nr:glycosyltransferase [Leptolyngbya ohadii]
MRSSSKSQALNTAARPTATYLFVFLEVFSQEGGIQSYVQDILKSYAAQGEFPLAQVLLLRDRSADLPTDLPNLSFKSFCDKSPQRGRLRLTIALLRTLIQQRPQRVFCGHIKLAPLVRMVCQPLGIPYTVLTYGKEVWEPLAHPEKTALQQADRLWTISRYSRDRVCAANGIDPAKVDILPCAVDGDRFTPGPALPELIDRYQLQGSTVIMTVARLWSGDIYKGVDVTLRALPTIAQAIPNVKYLVIGRGDDQPRLEKLAVDLGMRDRVVFAGFVPTADLVAHYRLADAYVMPSQEGFGIVYLEAMACGVSVISGDADGSADPLQDGRLGWRVPHRDPDAVAAACIELLQPKAQLPHSRLPTPHNAACIELLQPKDPVQKDDRCNGAWLRQQTLAQFGRPALAQRLSGLISGL